MVWVIVIAVIFVVLFLMILVPKDAKGYTDNEKLKDVAWGKGFKRIYFVASALWIGGFSMMLIMDPIEYVDDKSQLVMIPVIIFILAPIPVYFFIKWIILGFKKD